MYTSLDNEYKGYSLKNFHDSTKCERCEATRIFYKKMRAAKLHRTRASDDVQFIGLITYLDLHFGVKVNCDKESPQTPCKKIENPTNTMFNSNTKCLLVKEEKNSTLEKSSLRSSKRVPKQFHMKKFNKNVKRMKKSSERLKKRDDKTLKKSKLGTLKRKRHALKNLISDTNYEDDIFEEENTCDLVLLSDSESDSLDLQNMKTPKILCLTPREESSSPTYEDCYSPTELQLSRKDAEEYQFRRNKRRRLRKNRGVEPKQERKPDGTTRTRLLLEDACVLLHRLRKIEDERNRDEDEEEDYYFSNSED